MKESKIFEYYRFGFNFRIFLDSDKSKTNIEFNNLIHLFLNSMNEVDLPVTKAGLNVHNLEADFQRVQEEVNKGNGAKVIDPKIYNRIANNLRKLDSILDAELSTKVGYIIDGKRYSNDILTKEINLLFSPGTFFKLPTVAQFDFTECGLCLAFDRFTAAAYHILRGVEDVLKFYYSSLTGSVPTDKDTWFDYTQGITDKISDGTITPAPSEELMVNLNSLRKYYRNKTQHPDKIYNSDESQDLLGMAIKSVNEIIADIEKRALA